MENLSKKVKHGIKWQVIANIVSQAIYFVNGIVLARILMPKDFGLYGMAIILSGFVAVFWQLGISSAIIQRKEISDKHLNTAFTIGLMMGFLCFMIIWVVAPYLALFFKEPSITLIARLIGLTFIIYAFDRIPSSLLGRNMFFKNISLVGIVNPFLYGFIAIPLALMGFGPLSFAWGMVVGALAMAIIRIYWGFRLFKWKPKILLDKEAAKNLLGFGIFITMSGTINYLLRNIQRIITGKFLGSIDLGYFTKASNLSTQPVEKVRVNIITVLLPGFSSIQNDAKKIRDWFKKFNFFSYAIASPVLIFFIFFPREFVVGLFGDKWLLSASILPWLAPAVLVRVSDVYFQNILNAIGKPYLTFAIGLFMIIPVTVGLLIAVKWGIMGIAVALFIINVISLIVNLTVMQAYKVITIKDFIVSAFEPILISLLSCIMTYFIFQASIAQIVMAELKLTVLLCVYGIIIASFFCYRGLVKSYIGYLGFDIKKVIKIW
ncbi:lipopolysaccharide biosynthesis protein [Omnitrophica bacterium]|nr:lipopolysaccharide biosynthesis protein [Candidatus Omnitrophota bacterium]